MRVAMGSGFGPVVLGLVGFTRVEQGWNRGLGFRV